MEKTLGFIPDHEDKPSKTLIDFMEESNRVSGPGWRGYREFVDR
jgi:hypothetical protein